MNYQTRFRYTCQDSRGTTRKKSASLLVLGESFSDAEVSTYMYCEQNGIHDAEVYSITRSPIREVANPYKWSEGKPSWVVTLEDIFVTDEGKEKKLKYPVLFWSDEMPSATTADVRDYCLGIDPNGNTMHIVGVKKSDIVKEI